MEHKEKIVVLIKSLKQVDSFDVDIELIESGFLDSFDIINLIPMMEERFGIKIDGDLVVPENFSYVKQIEELVVSLLPAK